MASLFQRFVALGHVPDDPEEEKLRKSSLLLVSGPFSIAGLVWGLLYFSRGLVVPGSIPFIYGILSLGTIINFSITKKYQFFRNSHGADVVLRPLRPLHNRTQNASVMASRARSAHITGK